MVEFLEPRIAPAVIYVGGTAENGGIDDPLNTGYLGMNSPFGLAANSSDPGVSSLFAGSDDHYVLDMKSKDKVMLFPDWNPSGPEDQSFINVLGGRALAFFFDKNSNNVVEADEIVGFSISTATSLKVAGSVDGDIIGNFDSKTGLISKNALTLNGTVSGLTVAGGINGSLISGGLIQRVDVSGAVEQISTSSNGAYTYDFGGTGAPDGIGEALLAPYDPGTNRPGSNILNVKVGKVDQIIAGSGGAGGNGGAITNITVVSDFNGFQILGGQGGVGTRGGAGGAVTAVTVFGTPDPDSGPPVLEEIVIRGGDGGTVLTGAGGAGGAVSKIFVGYTVEGRTLVQSPFALNETVSVAGGKGGNGSTTGGAGGSTSNINIYAAAPNDPNINIFEINVAGGDGGEATAANGRGGIGGSVSGVFAISLDDDDATDPLKRDQARIVGGDAGDGGASGSAGGSLTNITVLADAVTISGGNGSNGTNVGGAGGRIDRLTFSFLPTDRAEAIDVSGGAGGQAQRGSGGAGGNVSNVTGLFMNFVDDTNTVAGGTGGTSADGRGGNGGTLSNVRIFESIDDRDNSAIDFVGGAGATGGAGGGIGGSIVALTFQGYATLPTVAAGQGGAATVRGAGGAGGSITNLALDARDVDNTSMTRNILVSAGDGGNGAAVSGRGGNGGTINTATVFSNTIQPPYFTGPNIDIAAGNGGGAPNGSVGVGGSVQRATALASQGDAAVRAGAAGDPSLPGGNAIRGAVGGSITNVAVSALNAVTIEAGNGQAGGAGGSITSAAFYGVDSGTFQPNVGVAPQGDVSVQAGQGSVGPTAAGAGGSIRSVSGIASDLGTTEILAGHGNGGLTGPRAAQGGSVSAVSIFGGTSFVWVQAGDGGSLASGAGGSGANGGSVSSVAGGTGVNFQAILGGNGGHAGTAVGRGGIGGSINAINVFDDIGRRSGFAFGVDGMGGLFAGAGGSGGASAPDGAAGRVTNVTAATISAIAAGRPTVDSPESLALATSVDRIYVGTRTADPLTSGFNPLTIVANPLDPNFGAFTNYDTANFVGGVAGSPTAPGANVFKIDVGGVSTPIPVGENEPFDWELGTTQPLDGLIAALSLTGNRNFRPNALLTADSSVSDTGYVLLDYRNNFTTNS